jgi:hypothetical protein
MPKLITSKQDHLERINIWSQRVININGIEWPESFGKEADVINKYTRFTGYVKEWMHGVLSSSEEKMEDIHPSERFEEVFLDKKMSNDWWGLAMKRSNGKNIEEGLPGAEFYEEKKRSEIYDRFMPAYKAIKESYDKRPWYEWIFNHAQYTAERDALKAIKGMILELTMDEPRAFESAYNEYTATVSLNEEIEQNEEVEQNYIENDKESRISIGNEVERDLNKTVMKRPAKLFADQLGEKLNDKSQSHKTAIERGTDAILKDCVEHERDGIMEAIRRGQFQQIAQDLNQKVDLKTDNTEKHRIMVEGTRELFKKVYKSVAAHSWQEADNQMVIAQKITDLYLKVYSPAGFDKAEFGKYADNYTLSYDDEIANFECLYELNPNIVDEDYFQENLENARNELGINKEAVHIENDESNLKIQDQLIEENDSELHRSQSSLNSNL